MKTTTWNIKVTDPAPSMNQTRTVFQADTYAAAVAVAHEAYRTHGRAVVLGSGEYGMECWHRVDSNGVATDRNTNSGIPATQQVARPAAADALLAQYVHLMDLAVDRVRANVLNRAAVSA